LVRAQFLWRKIINRYGCGDCFCGGTQLRRLGSVDQVVRKRFLDVSDVGVLQAIPQRLRSQRELECALEPSETIIAYPMGNISGQALARP
jgi:hypothetical protein